MKHPPPDHSSRRQRGAIHRRAPEGAGNPEPSLHPVENRSCLKKSSIDIISANHRSARANHDLARRHGAYNLLFLGNIVPRG